MRRLIGTLAKRSVVVGIALLGLTLASGAIAAVATKTHTPKAPKHDAATAATTNDNQGGPQTRMHDGCDLAQGLTGNWTHGDYVSAVADANPGDSAKIQEAAHSDCGKVDHSNNPHGQSAGVHGKSAEKHGKSGEAHGSSTVHGKSGETHGQSAGHRPSGS